MSLQLDSATLQAALAGYQQQLQHIEGKMAEVRRQLRAVGATAKSTASAQAAPERRPRKHRMSAEGRERIAAAQRARWAKVKRAKVKPAPKAFAGAA
jgi:hypothetical protein